MATTTIIGTSCSLITRAICADAAVRTPSQVVGLPGLRFDARATLGKHQRKFESGFVPTFSTRIESQKRNLSVSVARRGPALSVRSAASSPDQLRAAREDVKKLIAEKKCNPILIRLAWHDSGSYDKNTAEFPKRGGANGSIRYSPELGHGANSGLIVAVKLLEPIKEKYPDITYADLYQLASATAVEEAGGPKIPMKYGRVDVNGPEECAREGNLPDAGSPNPSDHLRKVFYRMDLNDQEIVALSGAHTLGRSRPERSGWGKSETKYTTRENIGAPGGQSWTAEWLKFDNSYFKDIKAQSDEDLLVLPTDKILTEDPEFKKYTDKYAQDQDAFFKDYALAHAKLSELGVKWDPEGGFSIDEAPKKEPVPEKFVAAKYSSGDNLSESMRAKMKAEYLAIGGSPDKPLSSNYFLNIIIVIAALAVLASLATQS